MNTNNNLMNFSNSYKICYEKLIPFQFDYTKILDGSTYLDQAWIKTKKIFDLIEPYYPINSSISIISKTFWKLRSYKQRKKEINRLGISLAIVNNVQRRKIKNCQKKIEQLKVNLQDKKDDQFYTILALIQLGCLLFPHPGSNVWNSVNGLAGRLFSLRSYFLKPSFRVINSISKSLLQTALSSVAVLANITSFLKQTEFIQENHLVYHGIVGAAFIGIALESGIMIKNWIRSLYCFHLKATQENRIEIY